MERITWLPPASLYVRSGLLTPGFSSGSLFTTSTTLPLATASTGSPYAGKSVSLGLSGSSILPSSSVCDQSMAYLSAARSFWSTAIMEPRWGEGPQQPLPATQFLPLRGGLMTTGFFRKTSVPPPVSVVWAGKRLLANPEGISKLAFRRCSSTLGTSRRSSNVTSIKMRATCTLSILSLVAPLTSPSSTIRALTSAPERLPTTSPDFSSIVFTHSTVAVPDDELVSTSS